MVFHVDVDAAVKEKIEAANVLIDELRRIAWAAIAVASVSLAMNIVMVIVMWEELS